MVAIDREACIGCGLCVRDCPGSALEVREGKARWLCGCIQCGHCVAVCPAAAVSIPEYDMDEVEEFHPDTFVLDPDTYLRAVKFRRSIRDFKDREVEREKLERIISAGRYTATAKNAQACSFVAVQERMEEWKSLVWEELPGIVEVLRETNPRGAALFNAFCKRHRENPQDDPLFFNAPACLVVGAKNPLDGGLAACNMENMAVAEGAGALYSGFLQRIVNADPRLLQWLGLEEKPVACLMLLGYPAVGYKRTAPRKKGDVVWR